MAFYETKQPKRRGVRVALVFLPCLLLAVLLGAFILPHYATRDGVAVLGYHNVVSDEEKATTYRHDRYTLSATQFDQQMRYLYDNGFVTYSLEEIAQYRDGTLTLDDKAVALTFDDGYKNFNTVIKPILERYGFQASCFVVGKRLTDNYKPYLNTDELQNTDTITYYSHSYDLHRVSPHGWDRKIIQDLSLDEIDQDFASTTVDNTFFAFPFGRSVEGIEPILQKHNVKLAFSYNQFRHVTKQDDAYYLPRYMIVDITPSAYFKWIVE